jgi:MFS family permease
MVVTRGRLVRNVFIVSGGNFLEMYDFMVYGYYAAALSRAYFPAGDAYASIMVGLAAFGAGFLMRPVGAVVLGAVIDRFGRRVGLIITIALMAVGTATIAFTPPYLRIGLAAPLIVLLGRLLQGFSAGVELGGVSVYLAEIAPPQHRGFFVAWQSASQQAAVMFAALLGVLLNARLSPAQMADWGWRVPFAVGCAAIPFLLLMRSRLQETPAFLGRARHPGLGELTAQVAANWPVVLRGAMLATMTTVGFYMITAYTPTFGQLVLHLSARASLTVTLCVGAANFVLLPAAGALSDRVGRKPLLVAATTLAILTAYPAMQWLAAAPSFARLLGVDLWIALLYASYNGAMVVHLTEIMPPQARTAGFSLAYSLATAIFGGFTPMICTWLIHVTGNRAMPGLWLSLAAALALAAAAVRAPGERARGEALAT